MNTEARTFPKAFAIRFKDLHLWSVNSFVSVGWHWPPEDIKPLRAALRRKHVEVDRKQRSLDEIALATLRFDGTIEPRKQNGLKGFKGKLFQAIAGDVVYSKIDVRNGAIGIVPAELGEVAVSSEFPVYEVLPDIADPEFVKVLFRTKRFRQIINGMISGASGRKRVQPTQIEDIEAPLPPLAVQRAIVAHWRRSQNELTESKERIRRLESQIPSIVYEMLASPSPKTNLKNTKVMALLWKDLERWSFKYLTRASQGLLGFTESKYPIIPLSECLIETTNGYCIKPVPGPTPHKMLKLNALEPAGLNVEASKFVTVSEKVAEKFSLKSGDLLMCRSVGSYEQIAKCALVEQDYLNILFPDIIIRVRLNEKVDPKYVREVIQTPLGRSYFQSNARTAVGMWKIGAEDISSFPLPLPSLEVQREIVRRVEEGRAEIAREREAAAKRARDAKAEVEALILGTKKLAAWPAYD